MIKLKCELLNIRNKMAHFLKKSTYILSNKNETTFRNNIHKLLDEETVKKLIDHQLTAMSTTIN